MDRLPSRPTQEGQIFQQDWLEVRLSTGAYQSLWCVEDCLQIQGGPFQMVFHVFGVDECPHKLHEINVQHLANLLLSLTAKLFKWCQMTSKECKRAEDLAVIFQDLEGLKAYIIPSLLESDKNKLSNDMWTSKNWLLDQNIWSYEFSRIEAMGRHTRILVIAYQRSSDTNDCIIRASTY